MIAPDKSFQSSNSNEKYFLTAHLMEGNKVLFLQDYLPDETGLDWKDPGKTPEGSSWALLEDWASIFVEKSQCFLPPF